MSDDASRLSALRANDNACSVAAADMLAFSEAFDITKYGWEGAPVHDPCAVAYLINPAMFGGRKVNVMVETTGTYTSGMSVVDWWRVTDREPNALFLRDVDVDGFTRCSQSGLADGLEFGSASGRASRLVARRWMPHPFKTICATVSAAASK